MPKRAAADHDHLSYRLRLDEGVAEMRPEHSYTGRLAICQAMRPLPPSKTWIKKRTRGGLVFYFAHPNAMLENSKRQRLRRTAERCGETPALPPPSFVWLPLEPSRHLWMTLEVLVGRTAQEAIEEALWSPISDDARDILKWWVGFVDDREVPLNYSVSKPTQRFARELANCETPDGLLVDYVGELVNDGSVDPVRRPELVEFPCLV